MYPERPDNAKQKVAAGLIVLIVIGLLAAGVMIYNSQQGQNTTTTAATGTSLPQTVTTTGAMSSSSPAATTATAPSSNYKDGTFTASSDYYVPHGSENISVTLTIKNGIVSDSSIQNSENNGESASYQEGFTSDYKSQVVGKPIDSLQLSYVAGASDTTQGFNDALDQIRNQAKA